MSDESSLYFTSEDGVLPSFAMDDVTNFTEQLNKEYPDPDENLSSEPYAGFLKKDSEQSIMEPVVESFSFDTDSGMASDDSKNQPSPSGSSNSVAVPTELIETIADDPMTGLHFEEMVFDYSAIGAPIVSELPVQRQPFKPWRKGLYSWIDAVYYNTTEQQWTTGSVHPPMIGVHVYGENYRQFLNPRQVKFRGELDLSDLMVEPIDKDEVNLMKLHGIHASQAEVTTGELEILDEQGLNKHRCVPSGLRNVWTME